MTKVCNREALNDRHFDMLREIGSIGSGNAATAISQLLGRPVNMSVPHVSVLDVKRFVNILGGPENQAVGVLFTLDEDFQGMVMFVTEREFAHLSLNALLGMDFRSFDELREMELSALKEVANIMVGSYLNAISDLTGMRIGLSAPAIAIDMAGAVLSVPALELERPGERALFIQDGFTGGKEQAAGHIILLAEQGYLEKMLRILGMEI